MLKEAPYPSGGSAGVHLQLGGYEDRHGEEKVPSPLLQLLPFRAVKLDRGQLLEVFFRRHPLLCQLSPTLAQPHHSSGGGSWGGG